MGIGLEPLVVRQAGRFLVVGLGSVAIDGLSYYAMILASGSKASPDAMKAVSFVLGTAFAFVANKLWTFASRQWSTFEVVAFGGLYASTMLVNVVVNHMVLAAGRPAAFVTAFLCATAVSTLLNFLGQKFIAFRDAQEHLRIFRERR
ncbi:MAG: GtrA family protein [Candidatus Rokubacteria bacterium]|nr:GtrA family protein [Candidatus Rokubacteria bacterium]